MQDIQKTIRKWIILLKVGNSDKLETSALEEKKNYKLKSTENISNCGKEGNVLKCNSTMSYRGVLLTLLRIGSTRKPPTSFSLVISKSYPPPKKKTIILTFSFNPLDTNFKVIYTASLKLLKLNHVHPSKNLVFSVKFLKIEVMVTSLMETLELPNFGHMITSTI